MSEHHGSCQEPSRGVCHALSGNVLGHVACALLEDCDALTHIHSRKQPWATNQASHLRSQQMYLRDLWSLFIAWWQRWANTYHLSISVIAV